MSTATNTLTRRTPLRGAWWVTTLFIAFGLVVAWWLLNLVIGRQCGQKCVIDTLAQMFRLATPIAFAAFCGVMCERAGVVDIGIEGKLLMGAMVAYAVNLFSYQIFKETMDPATAGQMSRWLALAAAVLSGLLLALLHSVV